LHRYTYFMIKGVAVERVLPDSASHAFTFLPRAISHRRNGLLIIADEMSVVDDCDGSTGEMKKRQLVRMPPGQKHESRSA
jgi:hypothetical protein